MDSAILARFFNLYMAAVEININDALGRRVRSWWTRSHNSELNIVLLARGAVGGV